MGKFDKIKEILQQLEGGATDLFFGGEVTPWDIANSQREPDDTALGRFGKTRAAGKLGMFGIEGEKQKRNLAERGMGIKEKETESDIEYRKGLLENARKALGLEERGVALQEGAAPAINESRRASAIYDIERAFRLANPDKQFKVVGGALLEIDPRSEQGYKVVYQDPGQPGKDRPYDPEVADQLKEINAANRTPIAAPPDVESQQIRIANAKAEGAAAASARHRAPAEGAKGKGGDPTAFLKRIEELSTKVNTEEGAGAKVVGGARTVKSWFNMDDDVSLYNSTVEGFAPMLARAVGHSGVLTQADVDSVKRLLPKPGTSATLAKKMIANVKGILSGTDKAGAAAFRASLSPEGFKNGAVPEVDARTPKDKGSSKADDYLRKLGIQ